MFPSLLPYFEDGSKQLHDGLEIKISEHCKQKFSEGTACANFYQTLRTKPPGYYQCPFGLTTRSIPVDNQVVVITGVVAHPRFGTEAERKIAKKYSAIRVSRETIDAQVKFLKNADAYRASTIEEASKVLPQAFHELRKLNAAVLQHTEREISDLGERRSLLSIKSAAELMRNNFDILEALSNIEAIRALPSDGTVNLFDLSFKMKRIYEERAADKKMSIYVDGVRAIVHGNQKTFPMVPAVLIENAIKYGSQGTTILVSIAAMGNTARLTVSNATTSPIDPERCFDRGARFSSAVEGGGFGLFLAREVVVAHKGTIRCMTAQGNVHMVVNLPLRTVIPI